MTPTSPAAPATPLDPGALLPLARVALGSTSPAKVRAAEAALARIHGRPVAVTAVSAPSGVPAQPVGSEETFRGALARARGALRLTPGALLGLGIEAGVERPLGETGPLHAGAWVVAVDGAGRTGTARSATFELPPHLAAAVAAGAELGTALDAGYGLTRAKDGPGAAGVLSRGLVDRSELYVQAILLALVPWLAPAPRDAA